MTMDIATILGIDGIATGAIYALVAIGTVLIFTVTRVIFIPFGDIAAFTALTLAALETKRVPGTFGLVIVLACLACLMEVVSVSAPRDAASSVLLPRASPDGSWNRLGGNAVRSPHGGQDRARPSADHAYLAASRPDRLPPGCRCLGSPAVDRFGGAPFRTGRTWPAFLRPRRRQDRTIDGLLDGDRGNPRVRTDNPDGRRIRHPDRSGEHDLLRFGVPDRPQGFRRRHRGRHDQLSGRGAGIARRRHSRKLRIVSERRVQGRHRFLIADSDPALAVARFGAFRRGGRGMTRSQIRLMVAAAILCLVAAPYVLNPFSITLLNYIGIYSLAAIGLALLTGVGGIVSFGQAAFVGVAAYTTAWTSALSGYSPWVGLLLAIILTCGIAAILGFVTLRLQGHFLSLSTVAWGLAIANP